MLGIAINTSLILFDPGFNIELNKGIPINPTKRKITKIGALRIEYSDVKCTLSKKVMIVCPRRIELPILGNILHCFTLPFCRSADFALQDNKHYERVAGLTSNKLLGALMIAEELLGEVFAVDFA